MNKWECIRQISKHGCELKTDTVLALLDWCSKPNTCAVTQEEAQRFLELLIQNGRLPESKCSDA